MKKLISIITIIIIVATVTAIATTKQRKPTTGEIYSLGTIIRLSLWGADSSEAVQEAIARIYEIDAKMSTQSSTSEIVRLNSSSDLSSRLSDETLLVIEEALNYSKLTQGAFDPTIGPIVELWGIGTDHERLPSEDEILKKLKLVDYRGITIDGKSVILAQKGQMIDLGGIAKGYAADQVVEVLRKLEIKSALIDLGGNIYALGLKPDGSKWKIGIQNPFRPRGGYLGILSTSNKSVVTSGNYERCFEHKGVCYHHIFDPRTGYPSKSGLSSVTIVSDSSMDGDALSTSVYIMGLEQGLQLIESLKGIEAILVEGRTVYLSSGLQDFSLTEGEFKLDQRR